MLVNTSEVLTASKVIQALKYRTNQSAVYERMWDAGLT